MKNTLRKFVSATAVSAALIIGVSTSAVASTSMGVPSVTTHVAQGQVNAAKASYKLYRTKIYGASKSQCNLTRDRVVQGYRSAGYIIAGTENCKRTWFWEKYKSDVYYYKK